MYSNVGSNDGTTTTASIVNTQSQFKFTRIALWQWQLTHAIVGEECTAE
jgi:hypothetical protein